MGAAMLLGGIILSSRAAAAGSQDILTAREIRLVDGRNKVRIWLKTDSKDAGFYMYDQYGRYKASLYVNADGDPGMILYDDNGHMRTQLHLQNGRDGQPSLSLADADGKTRAIFHLSPGGKPGLALSDNAGHVVWTAP